MARVEKDESRDGAYDHQAGGLSARLYSTMYRTLEGSGLSNYLTIVKIKELCTSQLTKKLINVNGYTMRLDKKDTLSLLVRPFEPKTTQFVKQNAKGIALDLGANIGYYSLLLSGLCKRVYAFEPSRPTFKLLEHNIKLNKISNIIPINKAVGKSHAFMELNYNIRGCGESSFVDHQKWQSEKEKVEMIKLDEFFRDKPKPDFIKMDIEGWEEEAIDGGRSVFKNASVIVFENNEVLLKRKNRPVYAVPRYLEGLGFDITKNNENFIARRHR
jgi:FkbM family methyltransferase